MKKTFFSFSIIIMVAFGHLAIAQSATDNSTKPTSGTKDAKKDDPEPKKTKRGSDQSIKNKDALFSDQNKAWILGVHAGFPMVIGDVPVQSGIGYGLNIQKAFGYSFALRLHEISGYTTGLNWQENSYGSLAGNEAVNGKNNPKINYYAEQHPIYTNYKMPFNK